MDYEPITKGLREQIARLLMSDQTRDELLILCEGVDAIQRSLEAENERLRDASERGDDWIKLPIDADGVPIRVGDVMENIREDLEPALHHTFKVYSIHYRAYGLPCVLTEDGYPTILYRANEVRHYHAPTVEDVLREFAADFVGCANCVDDHEVTDAIELFAPKLRLAGDAE